MRYNSVTGLGFAAVSLFPGIAHAASGSGHSTRYWDCCKPSCGWPEKAAVSSPVRSCNANDSPVGPDTKSGCDGGSAFTCTNNSPWAVNDDLAYGFAATAINGGSESSWCCACYALTFTSGPVSGKTMVVQSTNSGGDLSNNHFDILMPGGGLGIFDGCTPEFGGIPGARYGGVSSRSECNQMPNSLKAGCQWRFDWFENADNPDFTFKQVQCPSELTSISGCVRNDDSNFPRFNPPSGSPPSSNPPSGNPPSGNPPSSNPPSGNPPSSGGQTVALYGQCNGDSSNYPNGALPCASGSKCVEQNQWYSQCLPA